MIELALTRRWFSPKSTISLLEYGDGFICYILEPTARKKGVKITGVTAIPPGEYPFIVSYSPTFKRDLIEILNIPNFTHVRIHAGNYPSDTKACLIPGMEKGIDKVLCSKEAENAIMWRVKRDGGQGIIRIVQPLTIL